MPGPGSGPEQQRRALIREYGGRAFHAAQRDDAEGAARAVRELDAIGGAEHGFELVTAAMLAWIDTMLAAQAAPARMPKVAFAYLNADTGELTGPEGAPPEARWAGRLIAARYEDNEGAFMAALNDLPEDANAIGKHVLGLLMTCAWAVNHPDVLNGGGALNRSLN
jgi:hypothetical protein